MSKSYIAPEKPFREVVQDFGAPGVTNWRVYFLLLVPFLLSSITLEQVRFGGSLLSWVSFAAFFWLFTILVIEGLFSLARRKHWKKSHPIVVFLLLTFAGFLRGLSVYFAGVQLGLIPENDLLYRITVGPIFVVAGFATMHLIVYGYLTETKLNGELQSRSAELKSLETGLEEQISQLRLSLLDRVRNQLKPALSRLYKKLKNDRSKSDLNKSVNQLMKIVDEIVRPLSRDLALSQPISKPTVEVVKTATFRVPLPRKINVGSMIPLPFILTMFLLLGFPALAILTNPITGLLQIAMISAVTLAVFATSKVYLLKLNVHPVAAFVIVNLVGLWASLAIIPVQQLAVTGLNDRFFFQNVTFNTSVVTVLFIYQLIKLQVQISQDNLQEVVRKLELLTSALRQEAWVIQRNIATVLHGPVQAAMYAAALRLSQAKRPSKNMTEQICAEIDESIERLAKPDFLEGESLQSVLEQIRDLWSGLSEIEIKLPPELNQQVTRRPIVAQCVLEIAREGVSNAVKHGKAKKISIDISADKSEMLVVKVTNDGELMGKISTDGVGTALLNELSHSWKINSEEKTTELRALVSLAQRI